MEAKRNNPAAKDDGTHDDAQNHSVHSMTGQKSEGVLQDPLLLTTVCSLLTL
jgi:hypothetical protein